MGIGGEDVACAGAGALVFGWALRGGKRAYLMGVPTFPCLERLQDYAVFRGWGSRRIDGNTLAQDRQRYIDDFNRSARDGERWRNRAKQKEGGSNGRAEEEAEDPDEAEFKKKQIFLFFLSTKAGGQVSCLLRTRSIGLSLFSTDCRAVCRSDGSDRKHRELGASKCPTCVQSLEWKCAVGRESKWSGHVVQTTMCSDGSCGAGAESTGPCVPSLPLGDLWGALE